MKLPHSPMHMAIRFSPDAGTAEVISTTSPGCSSSPVSVHGWAEEIFKSTSGGPAEAGGTAAGVVLVAEDCASDWNALPARTRNAAHTTTDGNSAFIVV